MKSIRMKLQILMAVVCFVVWIVYPIRDNLAAEETVVRVEGHWASAEVGPIDLYQDGTAITGNWAMGNISGTISGHNCSFRYSESGEKDKVISVGAFVVQADGLSLSGTWSYQNGKETETGSFSALKVLNQNSDQVKALDAQTEELPAVELPMKLNLKEMIPNEAVSSFYDTLKKILPEESYSLGMNLRTEGYVIPLTNISTEISDPSISGQISNMQSIVAFREIPSTLEAVPDNLWSWISIGGSKFYMLKDNKEALVSNMIKVLDKIIPVMQSSKILNVHQIKMTKLESSLYSMVFSSMEKKEEEIRDRLVDELGASAEVMEAQKDILQKNLSTIHEYYRILSNINRSMNDQYQKIILNMRG